jgi:hypothetical protein
VWHAWWQGFPELLTDEFSCPAAYVGIGIVRINSVLLAALIVAVGHETDADLSDEPQYAPLAAGQSGAGH